MKTKRKFTRAIKITAAELEALNEAIHVHGIVMLAEKLKVKVNSIQNWRTRGVPPEKIVPIEEATGVSRKRLKPALYA